MQDLICGDSRIGQKTKGNNRDENMKQVIILDDRDNVATAIKDIEAGAVLQSAFGETTTTELIPFGHKVALVDLPNGTEILKYGEQIGLALGDIAKGACVHVHNVDSQRGRGDKGGK